MEDFDIFDRTNMSAAASAVIVPKTGLIDLFYGHVSPNTWDTESVDVEIREGTRGIAKYTKRGQEGTKVENRGYSVKNFRPPYIDEEKQTRASEFLKKIEGLTDESKIAKQRARAEKKIVDDISELKERVKRAEIKQVADGILAGKIVVNESGKDREIDFNMPSSHSIVYSGTDLWTADDSDPIEDIRLWREMIQENSGKDIDAMVFGRDVLNAFIKNKAVQTYFDNLRITLGEVKAQKLGNGLTRYADVEGVEIYTFTDWYYDEAIKSNKPVIPHDMLIFGATDADVSIEFGCIEMVDEEYAWVDEYDYYVSTYTTKKPKAMMARMESAPLYVLKQSTAFGNAKVV
jgi:hypothetical protein